MRLKSPCYVELAGIKDFARLVCALERAPLPAFSMILNREQVLAVQTDFINNRPVIYFTKYAASDRDQYLAYRITAGIEEAMMVESVANPTFIYTPVINIDKFPALLTRNARLTKKSGYIVIKLKDLSSLAKVAAYKTIYEEPPLPLFLFKNKSGQSIIGVAMSLSEADTVSYFYYVLLNDEPKDFFIRYTSQRVEPPSFSNKVDEHGYIFLKVIKLTSSHPLVETYD